MRPDQHKKKKNAAYKKRHGIPNQAKDKNDKSCEKDSKHLKPRKEETDSDEPEEVSHEERKRFSRRQVQSNWDRYEEEDQDAEEDFRSVSSTTKIGADFKVLLNKTGSATSHFHFKSEKEWENITENDDKAGSTLLSIDCKSLAQALRDIPLQKRLEIDKKYFEDEDLNTSNKGSLKIHGGTSINQSKNQHLGTEVNTGKSKQTNSSNLNFSKPGQLSSAEHTQGSVIPNQGLSFEAKTLHVDTRHMQDASRNEAAEEVDLDQLLGIETKGTTDGVDKSQDKRTNLQITEENSMAGGISQPSKIPHETKEDLEDWLDSILD